MAKKKKKSANKTVAPERPLAFIDTGCSLLNCVISGKVAGGYPCGRITNIVGDKSTGKTLLAIEACANFAQQYPDGIIYYNETESAFDKAYAASLGMPIERIEFAPPCYTVEDWYNHLVAIIEEDRNKPILYILDSLDALSDVAELARGIGDATMGQNKAKKMSELFRRMNQKMSKANLTLIIISQVRANIGVKFGRKVIRSGGHALDFFASIVLFLAHIKQLKKTKKKVERPTGVVIQTKCDKNKVSMPFRECHFPIIFNFGIDSVAAALEWAIENEQHRFFGLKSIEAAKEYLKESYSWDTKTYFKNLYRINAGLQEAWVEIEERFKPMRSKYSVEEVEKEISKEEKPRKAKRVSLRASDM